jgi:hypothetical protein
MVACNDNAAGWTEKQRYLKGLWSADNVYYLRLY